MDRRQVLTGFAAYALLSRALVRRALGKTAEPVQRWLKELAARCADLRTQKLAPAAWQAALDKLYRTVPLAELVTDLDLDKFLDGLTYPRDIGAVRDIALPAGTWDGIGHKIFAYKKGACTPPHAHNNVASAHLVLRGKIHVRTYDRVRDVPGAIEIAPTFDGIVEPGGFATMTDARHNVHWFVGEVERSCSLDIVMSDVTPDRTYATPAQAFGQIFVDPTAGTRAPILPFDRAVAKFGGR